MRGRHPIPTALHVIRGTWRADRHGPKPAPVPEPEPMRERPALTEAELRDRAEDIERRRRARGLPKLA
jgi:hypothetical protein